ncbi:MAG: gamma carbonic anhydrase family protein [Thaumarchaeota archaeon]|nr:gamma carbonic anhydrase family protein [Nitrososphaerota archaeon]
MIGLTIIKIGKLVPKVHADAFVAKTAYVAGNVTLGRGVSVLPGAVIRGDEELISVDEFSNVQDNAVLHSDPGFPTVIGKRVTVGHGAIVHGAKVNDDCLIGMGSIILNGSVIGRGSILGAGALVTEMKEFPDMSVLMGSPARIVRKTTNEDLELINNSYLAYLKK